MEFRLNKIDTNVRRKIDDKTKEGKIHKKKDIEIYNKDYKEEKQSRKKKKKDENLFKEELKKASITVKALKKSGVNEDDKRVGRFVDVKK